MRQGRISSRVMEDFPRDSAQPPSHEGGLCSCREGAPSLTVMVRRSYALPSLFPLGVRWYGSVCLKPPPRMGNDALCVLITTSRLRRVLTRGNPARPALPNGEHDPGNGDAAAHISPVQEPIGTGDRELEQDSSARVAGAGEDGTNPTRAASDGGDERAGGMEDGEGCDGEGHLEADAADSASCPLPADGTLHLLAPNPDGPHGARSRSRLRSLTDSHHQDHASRAAASPLAPEPERRRAVSLARDSRYSSSGETRSSGGRTWPGVLGAPAAGGVVPSAETIVASILQVIVGALGSPSVHFSREVIKKRIV